MSTPRSDDSLIADLRRGLAAVDAVPPAVLDAAKAVLTWRTIDAELAELTFDSAAERELAGVRSDGDEVRRLTFSSRTLTLEIEVHGGVRLVGQVVPPQRAALELRSPDGSLFTEADELGRFAFDVPPGPSSLVCRAADEVTITTDWTLY